MMKKIRKLKKQLAEIFRKYQQLIEGYGFVFNPQMHLYAYITLSFCLVLFTYYFELNLLNTFFLFLLVLFLLPIYILLQLEYLYEERQFKEFTLIIQSISSDFKGNPKIYTALQNAMLYCNGDLNQTISVVLEKLQLGVSFDEALMILDKRYYFYVLHNLIVLMCAVEKYGANEYEEGIELIQDDLDDCIEDMYMVQHQLISIKNRVYLLCILSFVIGILSKQMLAGMYLFSSSVIYQFSILIYALLILLALMLCLFSLRNTWRLWGRIND